MPKKTAVSKKLRLGKQENLWYEQSKRHKIWIEGGSLLMMLSKTLSRIQYYFLLMDDKIACSSTACADVSCEGVQRDILPIVGWSVLQKQYPV